MNKFEKNLYKHQKEAIIEQLKYEKCLINMWCGTGKTRTFTIDLFINNENFNVIVFPSLGLINQYCNDYILSQEEPFKTEFDNFNCLAFCSDDESKLKLKTDKIRYTTSERLLYSFLKNDKKIALVTYQSFEKFINACINKNITINNLIFDEAHHIVGDKIQDIVFNNEELNAIVLKTRFYTATPVNKNGITMYDRDDPENSDCGELAFEYLYFQAVEDGVCKPFETQISLYTQKPEYKDKYQPVFESIIRACLSGKYNYWNILTYHSYVNENEDMNDNISFVKDFASPKNQKLVKKLFTRIQNEEFPHTKELYFVENVILKGVHSKTPNREQIIKDFDRKVEGRIYILSSCGILNEGIDTKWANMGVPINPSKSIVKESQRIGRLVRIPDKNMQPAIILIPCEVDITKYSEMDTPEQRDLMIREVLSECGNFNTALNVISAFKYQYDPELFEMCLKYPNMYAPKEVKDNLAKQGLIIEESKGNLLDNLKYICEKERIDIDTESVEGENERDILLEIAKQSNKTIEIHTQNHDEPVKYVNEEASDEEPLRLFHCEDDNTYVPITKKDKEQKIKKKSTIPPKKRPKLFDVHTHPDLEVLWKIKEGSIDLNKTFSQGVLDVDINWNEKKWEENLEKVKEFMDENGKRPIKESKIQDEAILGRWLGTQIYRFKEKEFQENNKERYDLWKEFINDEKYKVYFISEKEKWYKNLTDNKLFIDTNKRLPTRFESNWITTQKTKYKLKREIMKDPDIYDVWTEFINDIKYSKYFKTSGEIWFKNLKKVKDFIDKNDKRPTQESKCKIEMTNGRWVSNQLKNYKNKSQNMKDPKFYDAWREFINDPKYKKYFKSDDEKWIKILQNVKDFMDKNDKRPGCSSEDEDEKYLGNWINNQLQKKNKSYFINNENIYCKWIDFKNDPKYMKYFLSNKEKWCNNLEESKVFIDENNTLPSSTSKNKEEQLIADWLVNQQYNYKNKKGIMEDKEIYNTWTKFINNPKYKEYFKSDEEEWNIKLGNVKEFIDEYNKRPSSSSKNKEENLLGCWMSNQIKHYKNKSGFMKEIKIYDKFTEFINDEKYKEWNIKLEKVKGFMDKNERRPNKRKDNTNERNLGSWINTQLKNYKNKTQIMGDKQIYDTWTEFINNEKYKGYFASIEEEWFRNLEKSKQYLDKNKKRPKKGSSLSGWIQGQIHKYKNKIGSMLNKDIYNTWTKFINDSKYQQYFLSNEEEWYIYLEKVKEYIDEHKSRPSCHSKNYKEKNLAWWIGTQIKNYPIRKAIMEEDKIYNSWTDFINELKYKQYFLSNNEAWYSKLEKVKKYLDVNKILPKNNSKIIDERNLITFINNNKSNHIKKEQIMRKEEIYNAWSQFINDPKYSKYFDTTKQKSKKDMSKPEIKPKKTDKEIGVERQQRAKSELSVLHQKYKTKNSQNLNTYFKENPEKWKEYHKISKDNEESFPEEEIPRNKMIKYLENLPGKKKKVVADLGCGFAEINQHFKDNSRFEFHNFDHHSSSEFVVSRDIKNTGLDDYSIDVAILSLAMWGSNCKDYLEEAHRILDTGGTLLIAEAYTRWNKELDEEQRPINKLVILLEENNFTIKEKIENKFMFIECRKN